MLRNELAICRRMVLAVAAVTMMGLVLFTLGSGVAHANGQGVGPSEAGATGADRACEALAQNEGGSAQQGLECATLDATVEVWASADFLCIATVTGSGLAPGTPVTGLGHTHPFTVEDDGTVYFEELFQRTRPLGDVTLSATTASGGTITRTFDFSC